MFTEENTQYVEKLENVCDRIALMAIYRDEWKHRDDMFISLFWKFVYLSLIIVFLPDFLEAVDAHPPIVNALSRHVFSVLGIICSAIGLFFGLAENERITRIDLAYKELSKVFPEKNLPLKIEKKIFRCRLNRLLCFIVYGIIILVAIINIIFL